jgi:hypothetical protein
MTTTRRGWTLGLTFGVGPVFAVLGSFASQLILSGNFLDLIRVTPVPRVELRAVVRRRPAMWLAAGMVSLARLPPGAEPPSRTGITRFGRGLRLYFTHP